MSHHHQKQAHSLFDVGTGSNQFKVLREVDLTDSQIGTNIKKKAAYTRGDQSPSSPSKISFDYYVEEDNSDEEDAKGETFAINASSPTRTPAFSIQEVFDQRYGATLSPRNDPIGSHHHSSANSAQID